MLFLSLTVYFFPSLSGFSYGVLFHWASLKRKKKTEEKKREKKKEGKKKKSMGNLG